jgi:hypothetical protein
MLARFMMSKTFIGFSRSAVRIFSRSVIAVPRFGDADVAQQICEFARSENNSLVGLLRENGQLDCVAGPAAAKLRLGYIIVEVDAVAASMITVRALVEIFKAHEAMGSGIMGLSSQFVSPVRPGSGECLIE